MVIALTQVNIFIDVFFLEVKESAVISRVATDEVLKGSVSYLCY